MNPRPEYRTIRAETLPEIESLKRKLILIGFRLVDEPIEANHKGFPRYIAVMKRDKGSK